MQELIGKGFLSGFHVAKTVNNDIYNNILTFDTRDYFKPSDFVAGVLFEESSSRTRFSTESAIQKLGGNIIHFSSLEETSIKKGESIQESAKLWSHYFDLIAIRSKTEFLPFVFNKYASVPVINLGDGSNEHPTQGLATLVHAYQIFQQIDGLNICLWGDFIKSRTMHSVAIVFSLLGANVFIYSIPEIVSKNPVIERIKHVYPAAKVNVVKSIEKLDSKIDIFYITRLQQERWKVSPQYNVFLPQYCSNLSKDGIILHSLPHNEEINNEVLFHKKSRIYEHIKITQQTRAWLLYSYKTAYEKGKILKDNTSFYEEVFSGVY